MSLLMQALKKAERARQSGLQEEEVADSQRDEPEDEPRAPDPFVPPAGAAPSASTVNTVDAAGAARPAGGLELSLEPLDDGTARTEPPPPPPRPTAIEPAMEAAHNPVPPQARHEGARARPDPDAIPVGDARAAPRPASETPRRGPGAPERRAVARTPVAQNDKASGVDVARLRIAGLSGLLVIVGATFGYLYWQAVTGPGPGASLPMVPMPPPSATGATNAPGAASDGGIVVAPAGPPFGPLDTAAPAQPAMPGQQVAPGQQIVPGQPQAAPAVAATAPPAPAAPVAPAAPPAPAAEPVAQPAAAPRARRGAVPAGPTPAQLAAIRDPAIREQAMRDAAERAERAAQAQAMAAPPAGSPASEPAVAGAAPGAQPGPAPMPVPAQAPAMAPGTSGSDVQVARNSAAPAVNPAVQAGFAAFSAGDLATARQQYATALRGDPNNRDALLGSAAVAARERRDDEAAGYYSRMLAANPRDAEAIAGLTALRPGDGDRAEVRLRGVLRNNPEAAPVHFALGNLYARQGRWQEAQQAYFRAWTAVPGNADYAFNLAVGLDRLNQGRLARDYYQRALALAAAGGAAAFDRAAVQRRLAELAPAAPASQPAGAPALPAAPATPAPATAAGN